MVELEWSSGLRADDAVPALLADRETTTNAIEAPTIVAHDDYFYLFVSRDSCCQGSDSTYNIAVGRSGSVEGPYLDANGASLLEDGGTPLLETDGTKVGPGGESVSGSILAFHYYDADNDGAFRLGLIELGWEDGWPIATWE